VSKKTIEVSCEDFKIAEYKLIEELYLHIGNGGVTVAVEETKYGAPCLTISAMHMGHLTNKMRIFLDSNGIGDLSLLFQKASLHNFEKSYCAAAKSDNSADKESCDPEGTIIYSSGCSVVENEDLDEEPYYEEPDVSEKERHICGCSDEEDCDVEELENEENVIK